MLRTTIFSIFALALAAATPLAATATPSPKPMMSKSMSTPHQCRDAKGHFVKGKYAKCPAGTHKAM